jgi:hypothetical protein
VAENLKTILSPGKTGLFGKIFITKAPKDIHSV